MARSLRYVPAGSVVEVTARTIGSRFLLRPDAIANDLILGVVGRAQSLFGIRIYAFTAMSNHIHALLGVEHASQLAAFMQHILANIARELGRHHRWSGPFWSRRYRSIIVADDESQAGRLTYVLCQGLKEGLVDRAEAWPGASTTTCLMHGTALKGRWHNRTAEFKARRRGSARDSREASVSRDTDEIYELCLSQIPAFADKTPEEYKTFIRELVRNQEAKVRAERVTLRMTSVLGRYRLLHQHPHGAPVRTERRPAPLVHAAASAVRAAFRAAYRAFVDAFRTAAACLRTGEPADFPQGSFPPALPFVKGPAVQ